MWEAVRYRRSQAVVLVLLSGLISACVALAPVYDRAMQQALTRLTTAHASVDQTAVRLSSLSTIVPDRPKYRPKVTPLPALASLLPAGPRSAFDPPIYSTTLAVSGEAEDARSPVGELLWRAGACAQLTLVSGSCPSEADEIAVSGADARHFHLRAGSTIRVVERTSISLPPGVKRPVVPLTVAGVYRQRPSPYWGGRSLTGISGLRDPTPPNQPYHDTWLTARATFPTQQRSGPWRDQRNTVEYLLDRPAFDVDDALRLGPEISRLIERAAPDVASFGTEVGQSSSRHADVRSGLPALAETVQTGRRQARITVPLLMVQLGLLGLVVLVLVLAAAVEQRRPEIAVARIRGRGPGGGRRVLVRELLPPVLGGVPLGAAAALGLATVGRHVLLHGAAPFEVGGGFYLAVVATGLVVGGVTWLIAWRVSREPVATLLRRVPERTPDWKPGIGEAMVIAVAGTTVAAFVTGGLSGPLALAAPTLIALLVGLLLANLVVPVCGPLSRSLLRRRRYAGAVIAVSAARRPAARRLAAIVTVSSALLVFAADAVAVGVRNRSETAEQQAGAAMTLGVSGTNLLAVRRALAGPDAAHVTPVVRIPPAFSSSITTVGVLPDDYRRIAYFPRQDPSRLPWRSLTPPRARQIGLTGHELSLRVAPVGFSVTSGRAVLEIDLVTASGGRRDVELGPIAPSRTAVLRAAVPCGGGCTVLGMTVRTAVGSPATGFLTISDVQVPGGDTDLPGGVGDWRPEDVANTLSQLRTTQGAAGGLTLQVNNVNGGQVHLVSTWIPVHLPGMFPAGAVGPSATQVNGQGVNRDDIILDVGSTVPRLPGDDQEIGLVDLDVLLRTGTRLAPTTTVQVLFDSQSPDLLSRVTAALKAHGVQPGQVTRLDDVRRTYDDTVPAWSLALGILAGAAGLVIAALVLLVLAATGGRTRARDLASLRMSGVRVGALRRMATGEQLVVVVLASLAGAACGLVGARFALPTVPQFAEPPTVLALDLSTVWPVVGVATVVELVVLATVAWLAGRGIAHRAGLDRVKESA